MRSRQNKAWNSRAGIDIPRNGHGFRQLHDRLSFQLGINGVAELVRLQYQYKRGLGAERMRGMCYIRSGVQYVYLVGILPPGKVRKIKEACQV
jgi:hypothetical protein